MHFLCLHGKGTNSKVLEMQTLALRYAIGPEHTYDFVEGGEDVVMEPRIASIVSPTDTFHAYFDPDSATSMLSALDDLDGLIAEADPPYDAIMGFSHGCILAATLLTRPAAAAATDNTQTPEPLPFKLAVFLSAGPVADYAALVQDKMVPLQPASHFRTIDIPTVHIFDENDEACPGHGKMLQLFCKQSSKHVATHRLGHNIPGNTDRKDLVAAITVLKKGVAEAQRL